MKAVHNGQVGHMGSKTTWTRLNKQFPGHRIPFKAVQEFVAACPTCNKTRLGMKDALIPIIRTLKPPQSRTAIGIDAVEITPHGEDGYTHINVVVNLFTKLTALYPVKGVTALNLANSCWKYWCTYGHTDMIISDQGPDLTSKLYAQLVEYMGMRHAFSIANRHANGVERTIGEVVRHLRAMVFDASKRNRQDDVFKDPSWIDSVQYILNSEVNSETGFSPFELTFGSEANRYLTMAEGKLAARPHARLSKLNANLVKLHQESKQVQDSLVETRREAGVLPEQQNTYQQGDLVLFDKGAKAHPKMNHRYSGPFEVKGQVANDVTCQQLATGGIYTYDVTDLTLYSGSHEQAYDMACRDQDQHVIDKILSFKGDPLTRSTLVFKVKFQDGSEHEVPYSKDLYDSIPYEDFCNSKPYLKHLTKTALEGRKWIQAIEREPLTGYRVHKRIYLDIRVYGHDWFDRLLLPDAEDITYVSPFKVTLVHKHKLEILSLATHATHLLSAYQVYCYVHTAHHGSEMTVIDDAFRLKYPQVTKE